MSTASASANPQRMTTMVFRRFREKHTALSSMYWASEFGRYALQKLLDGADPGMIAAKLPGVPFKYQMLPERVDSLLASLDGRAGTERLHLLVISSANLESFLQDSIELYVAANGNSTPDRRLTIVGQAVAAPVVAKSSVPAMLDYVQHLLGISFGSDLATWIRAYELRCSAAHEGGVMSARTAKKLKVQEESIGDWIKLSWDELREFLSSAYDIAAAIDQKISTAPLRRYEVEWTLARWKRERRLPGQDLVWKVLHEEGVRVPNADKKAILRWLYK